MTIWRCHLLIPPIVDFSVGFPTAVGDGKQGGSPTAFAYGWKRQSPTGCTLAAPRPQRGRQIYRKDSSST